MDAMTTDVILWMSTEIFISLFKVSGEYDGFFNAKGTTK